MNLIVKTLASIFIFISSQAYAEDWQSRVIQEIKSFYTTWEKSEQKILTIEISSDSLSESASADTDGKLYKVTIESGLLKNQRLTPDGLRMIICHEIGHLFGGAPRRNVPFEWTGPMADDGLSFLSSEGQADYYASLVCFREVLKSNTSSINNQTILVPPNVASMCKRSYNHSNQDFKICEQTALGAMNMLTIVKNFPIAFETPDQSITKSLIRDAYPSRQCRLDTFLAGALCSNQQQQSLRLDFNNAQANDCNNKEFQRPKCWFL